MNSSHALLIVIHNFTNAYSSARDACRAAQTQMDSNDKCAQLLCLMEQEKPRKTTTFPP